MTKPVNPLEEWLTRPGGLAETLKAARRAANLTGAQLAAENGWPTSKIPKIEGGRQTPTDADVEAWMRTCGASERQTSEALAQLEQIRARHQDWRRRMRTGQVAVQAGYNQLVHDATMVREFQTVWVPGLLQTAAYARYPIAEGVKLHDASADDIDAAVATRMQRQQHLYDPSKRFEFLLCEPVLRWLICPPDVMLGQLDRLHAVVAGMPNVRFGILPMGRKLATVPQNTFTLYCTPAGDVGLVETFTGEYSHVAEEAAQLGRICDWLWEDAVEGDDARGLITAAAEAIRRA